jgi:hypothetical protein
MFQNNESEPTKPSGLGLSRRLPRSSADFRKKQMLVVGLLASLIGLYCGAAFAADTDDSLLVYAVNIHQTPMQTWGPGYGIYLGKGLFITAAHVAGHTWLTRPKVSIGGQEFPTIVVKAGNFETVDLTLLAVDESRLPLRLSLRRNPLCEEPPWPSERVITVVPEGTARSQILSPKFLPISARRFDTVIRDVAQTGNSGSGVFDANKKCLLGIMSRKISQPMIRRETGKTELVDIAKYFVPASVIAAFIPAEYHLLQ